MVEAFPNAIVTRTRDNGSSVHFPVADNFNTLVGSPSYCIVFPNIP